MAVIIDMLSPIDGSEKVSVNTEIVISIIEDTNLELDVSSFTADVDGVSVYASETFQNSWSGELINNNSPTNDDFTLILIRPISNPEFNSDSVVVVDVNALVL